MSKFMIYFTNGTQKEFEGRCISDSNLLHQIAEFCEANGLITEKFEEIPDETVYTTLTHTPLPEPTPSKSVISISATVHEEEGTWTDWWIDCDDPKICLPYDERELEKYLRKYDIILVGDKWFAGKDADKAIQECYRQYRKITILDDDENVIAEIFDKHTMWDCTEDFGKYRWMNKTCGNVEHSFADVLECAEDGETYQHNYKGW